MSKPSLDDVFIINSSSSLSDTDQGSKESAKRRKLSDEAASKIPQQSQLNFSSANGHGPVTLKLKLSPRGDKNQANEANEANQVNQVNEGNEGTEGTEGKQTTPLPIQVNEKQTSEDPSSHSSDIEVYEHDPSSSAGRPGWLRGGETTSETKHFVKILQAKPEETHPGDYITNETVNQSFGAVRGLNAKAWELKEQQRRAVVSRTTIIRDKGKNVRFKFGPLLPLDYTMYDDNAIDSPYHKTAAAEKLAFGFPVEHKPWAFDIIYIISFLSTFRTIIKVEPLGPVDFEEGLGLGLETDNSLITKLPDVSPAMDSLFRKLVALVLNRKKAIARDGQRSALQELKTKSVTFGLPQEWRDDSDTQVATKTSSDTTNELIDTSKPDVSIREIFSYGEPSELMNPFHEVSFEKFGLNGIGNAEDRCIMLRSLVTWSLSESTSIRQFLNDSINQQDTSGERETFYAPRTIMKGFINTLESKKDLDHTIRVSSGLSLADFTAKYEGKHMDPTADPLAHPQAFRLNEFIAGDCGFHVGRFYLVRMADASSGRISSLDQMHNTINDHAAVRSKSPSRFSLYVEDTHSLLTDSLAEFGVEFDENGNEVKEQTNGDESQHWYCVASTCEQLQRFVNHLAERLGFSSAENPIPQSCVIFKPALCLYQYLQTMLPLLLKYENLRSATVGITRASRRRRVEYGAQSNSEEEEDEEEQEKQEEEVEVEVVDSSEPEGPDDEYVE